MKKKMTIALVAIFASITAIAGSTTTVNGVDYTCSTRCDITTGPGGRTVIQDCCGGTVTTSTIVLEK